MLKSAAKVHIFSQSYKPFEGYFSHSAANSLPNSLTTNYLKRLIFYTAKVSLAHVFTRPSRTMLTIFKYNRFIMSFIEIIHNFIS